MQRLRPHIGKFCDAMWMDFTIDGKELYFLKPCCRILFDQCHVIRRRCAALATVSGSCTLSLGFLELVCRLTLFSRCILVRPSRRETATHHSANMNDKQGDPWRAAFCSCPLLLVAVQLTCAVAGSAHELRCPELRCCAELDKRVHRTRPSLLPQRASDRTVGSL